ncbi:thymopoietin a isoform X6 [Notolabrus celidotus]|uniref:thymopoietin a isoform X6 n=1 Tax=Notolabrus celidotus TaxID=1203425 RepID=UPI00148F88EA|nr:thymopoietin a isoform X6 [Notolabrus celidotus]
MPVYLDDPSVLTKDKLKSELMAHNVELPGGNPTKDVYVQLYLKNLTAQNLQHGGAVSLDAFSSDEELPPVVISSRSRSSGRKAVRKTDKVRAVELDVTELTDEGLKDELLKLGADVGPIVASTRKVYEKKLQKLLDNGPTQVTQLVVTEIQVNHNGNSESDLYSDKEDEVIPEPEPEPITQIEPEPVPVVERPLRSRGKTPVTTRSSSSKHKVVEKIAASEPPPKEEESIVLKELFPNDINSPTGITATCRRPIRGAAGRPLKSSDLWNDENSIFSPKTTKTSSSSSYFTESHIVNRVSSLPLSSSSASASSFTSSSSSRPLAAAPPAAQTKAASRGMALWKKLILLAVVAAFLFLVYQAMETTSTAPFKSQDAEVASGSTA